MAEPTFVLEVERVDYFDDRFYAVALSDQRVIRLKSVTVYLDVAPKPYLAPFYKNNTAEEIDRRFKEGQIRGSRLHWAFYVLAKRGVPLFRPPGYKNPSHRLLAQVESVVQQCKNAGRPYCFIEDQDEWMQVLRVREWFRTIKPQVVASELVVWSIKENTAGMLDLILDVPAGKYQVHGSKSIELEAGLYIGDYKTGNIDQIINFAQIAAYYKCLEEDLPALAKRVKGGILIHPNATTTTGPIPGMGTYVKTLDELLSVDYPYFKNIQAVHDRHNPRMEAEVFDFDTIATLDEDLLKDVQTGQAENQTLTQQLLESVNLQIEKKGDADETLTKKDKKKPAPEQEWEVGDRILTEIVKQIKSVYSGTTPQENKGVGNLLQRAFLVDGKPIATGIKELYGVLRGMKEADALALLKTAQEQVTKDVAEVKKMLDDAAGGEKKS